MIVPKRTGVKIHKKAENLRKSVTEPVTESGTEPVTGLTTESVTEPVTESGRQREAVNRSGERGAYRETFT